MTQREDVVRWALAQVGKPYSAYRDCTGFAAAAYRQVGITIPEGSVAQFGVGKAAEDGTFRMGDLLFWDTFGPAPGHVALYIGNEQVVHALNEQRGIVISQWDANMGGPFMGARRIFAPSDSPVEDVHAPAEESPRLKRKRRRNRRRERD
jgi:cell wall-associated NlpC family hydrolase